MVVNEGGHISDLSREVDKIGNSGENLKNG